MSSCSILTTAPPSCAAIVLAQVSLPGASCCRRSLVLLCRRRCAHEAAPYPPGHGHGTSRPWPRYVLASARASLQSRVRRSCATPSRPPGDSRLPWRACSLVERGSMALAPPRAVSLLDALRPPGEQSRGGGQVVGRLEGEPPVSLGIF